MAKTSKNRIQRRSATPRRTGPQGSGSRPQGAPAWLWALGLGALAFFHRLCFLRSNRDRDWPFTIFYEGDSEFYFRFARSVAGGEVYDQGLPFHPPGFAYLLSWIHSWVGDGERIPHFDVKVVLAGLSSMAVCWLYLLTRRYLGHRVGLVAGLLATYHFGLYVISVAPVTEGVFLSLSLGIWYLFVTRFEHPLSAPDARPTTALWAPVLLGALAGCAALVRAEAMLLPFLLVAFGLWGSWSTAGFGLGRLKQADVWGPWLVTLAAAALVVAPWTLHNHRTLSELNRDLEGKIAEPLPTFVPITIYGPLNLALANNSLADGSFSRDVMSSQKLQGNLDLEDPQHLEFVLHGDRMARRWIAEHPGDFLTLMGKKWELASRAATLGFSQWNQPGGLDGVRRPVDVMTPERDGLRWILLPLAGAGLVVLWLVGGAARRWLWLSFAATLLPIISITVFFGYVRQGLLMMPWVLVLVAAVLVAVAERGLQGLRPDAVPDRLSRRRALALVALVAVTMAVLEYRGVDDERNYEATGTTIPGSHKLNRDQPVTLKVLPSKP